MDYALVIPDSHIPFEDLQAWELLLLVAHRVRPRIVVLLGDFLDCYGFSFYEKHPAMGDLAELYDREISCAKMRIMQLEKLGAGKYVYLEGNHEFRLKKYIAKFAPALRNRLALPGELGLSNAWEWVPFTKCQRYEIPRTNVWCRHVPPVGGAAQNVAKQSGATTIYGHTHQIQEGTFVSKLTRQKIRAINAGNLVDESHMVFDYTELQPDWSKGFALVSSTAVVQQVHIQPDYSCLIGFEEFRLAK